mgnify:CR=1 FL=1
MKQTKQKKSNKKKELQLRPFDHILRKSKTEATL